MFPNSGIRAKQTQRGRRMGGQPRPGLLQGGGWLWLRSPTQGAVGYGQLAGVVGACWHDRLLRGARRGGRGRLQGDTRKGRLPTGRPQGSVARDKATGAVTAVA
ncbi:hypothetical protein B296_00013710 [Ensete ventricosum]|uniref:Uncharacterized protein n=1 Tax=Ensete ventricosum TaxID=4639 RepID=A0A426Y0F6_ENSVE|nr:hypothetical protein B296_00013710 [Ensete ventricosum]